MNPRFSIVIPFYNAEQYLLQCLDSLAAQEFTDFEVLAVNDGSTDGSREILQIWQRAHTSIKCHLIEQPNAGLGAARNAGIARAAGQYVALLDADDFWTPDKLKRCDEYLQNHPSTALLFHPVRTFGIGADRVRKIYPPGKMEELLLQGNPLVPSAVILKSTLFPQYNFSENLEFHGVEDLHLWIRLLHAGVKFQAIAPVLTFYRESGGMSTALLPHLEKVWAVLDHYYAQGYFGKSLLQKARRRKYYEAARFCHKRGQFAEARKYYHKSGMLPFSRLLARVLNLLRIKT